MEDKGRTQDGSASVLTGVKGTQMQVIIRGPDWSFVLHVGFQIVTQDSKTEPDGFLRPMGYARRKKNKAERKLGNKAENQNRRTGPKGT